MTKDEYFKLCTALVQEQVYAWGITSSLICLSWKPPRYGGRHALETELVYIIKTYLVFVMSRYLCSEGMEVVHDNN